MGLFLLSAVLATLKELSRHFRHPKKERDRESRSEQPGALLAYALQNRKTFSDFGVKRQLFRYIFQNVTYLAIKQAAQLFKAIGRQNNSAVAEILQSLLSENLFLTDSV